MVSVSYHCPRCGAVAALERGAYLDDKCVTAEPLDGWDYADAHAACDDPLESGEETSEVTSEDPEPDQYTDKDGVVIVCGAVETDGEGCGEPYYLSFVRFEDGREVDPSIPLETVSFDFRR